MSNPYVRSLGRAETIDGFVGVGVDYDSVSLERGNDLFRFTHAQAEEFMRLFVAACWEAGTNAALMADDEGAADRALREAAEGKATPWEYDEAPEPPHDENHYRYHTPNKPLAGCAWCEHVGWAMS